MNYLTGDLDNITIEQTSKTFWIRHFEHIKKFFMQITLKDIAKKTGFSITTISRALAGYDDVNEQTRQKILQIAGELEYQPNILARNLRNQRVDTIGFVIPSRDSSFSNEFFSQFMLGIGASVSSHHFDLLISAQTPGTQEMDAYRRLVEGRRVAGMVLTRTRTKDDRISYLLKHQHPFVMFGRLSQDEHPELPYIDLDSEQAFFLLVEHLASLGHQKIAAVLPPKDLVFTHYRELGYLKGLEHTNLPQNKKHIFYTDLTKDAGYETVKVLLKKHPEVTAICCGNDLMALGAIQAVEEMGRKVGKDIAITGFDGLHVAEAAGITTIEQPIYEIGQALADMLIQCVAHQSLPNNQRLLLGKLVVRTSTHPTMG